MNRQDLESSPLPNQTFDHAFAIIRVDTDSVSSDPSQSISAVKVLWNQDAAEREAQRLNELNRAKSALYFWQLTRIEKRSSDLSNVKPDWRVKRTSLVRGDPH
jgi:hypothetical protein